MLDGRRTAIAGLVAFALGVAASAVGCANGSPADDAVVLGADAAVPDTFVPPSDSGTAPPPAVDAGCQQKSDCPDGLVCDTGSGTCVGCNGDGDCPPGKLCDATTKTCAPGCNANHTCETGKSCCNSTCLVTNTVTACSGCGLACDTAHSTGPSCDGKTCAYTGCGAGFGDCKTAAPNTDGCETPTNTPTDCGGCGRACATTNVAGTPTCNGTACTSACNAGFGNCSLPVGSPDGGVADDGCESNLTTCVGTPCCGTLCGKHINGLGQNYTDCTNPLGTPGNGATYKAAMANEAAVAWPGGGSVTSGACDLGNATCVAQQGANQCAVWCYAGSIVGYVNMSAGTGYCGQACCCPRVGTDPTWN
jgi:hypothetical protein